MRVVMVNDCAYVGETLIKYLPDDFSVLHLKRSRRFLDKTIGIAWKVLRANADLYHVNYLLQDCYLALKFGKRPIIGHAHGSDLRDVIKSRKWGWIVKHNLRKCDKILVAQPTILEIAEEFNDTAEYFPIPYDPKIFYPKPLPEEREVKHVFLASPNDYRIKGTNKLLHALASVDVPLKLKSIWYGRDVERANKLAEKLGLKIEFIGKVPHEHMNELYWKSDVVLGSFGIGQLDTVTIEAMACGRPVVHSVKDKYFSSCPLKSYENVETAEEDIRMLLGRRNAVKQVKKQLDYVCRFHSGEVLARRLARLYSEAAHYK
jgi:glycosyltransferase involved in cell wall biosynthesis